MEEPLVPPGNPLRPRSLWYGLLGVVGLVVLMASDAHWVLSVPLGLVFTLLTATSLLDFAGCFDDADEPPLGLAFEQQAAFVPPARFGGGPVTEELAGHRLVFRDAIGQEFHNVHKLSLRPGNHQGIAPGPGYGVLARSAAGSGR